MKKRTTQLLAAAVISLIFSSCNRGYGCPTNFSLEEGVCSLFELLL